MGKGTAMGRKAPGQSIHWRMFFLLALVAGCLAAIPPTRAAASASPATVEGQIVLGFEETTTTADRDAIVAALGGRTLWELSTLPVRLVELPKNQALPASILPPGLRYAEPNYIQEEQALPNDYGVPGMWGLHNTGQTIFNQVGTVDADIDTPEAWDITTGSQEIVVGILDSGVDLQHPDLAGNLWTAPAGWNVAKYPACGAGTHGIDTSLAYTAQVYDCAPNDEAGHGTHVAGTIGAIGNNGIGVTGVAQRTSMMILKHGGTGSFSTFNTAVALDYALLAKDNGINLRVINGSFGGPDNEFNQLLHDFVAAGNVRNILFVFAAGNGGTDGVGDNNETTPFYPANYDLPNIITVAATDNRDQLASFSNYGAQHVHLAAPGVNVLSTFPTYAVTGADTLNYGINNGTSMASPHVAGAAALVLSAPGFGNLTATELRQRLVNCGDPVAGLAGKISSGKRLNVRRAIDGCTVTFSDVPPSHQYYQAITSLATQGVIKGYADGRYGPEDTTLRAQMAVLIVRAMGWSGDQQPNPFNDGGALSPELWAAVATLAAKPYPCGKPTPCLVATGYGGGKFGPNDKVLHAQTISFITRAMVARGTWQLQPDNDPGLYPSVAIASGHRQDVLTYYHYAGVLPGTTARGTWDAAFQPSTRGWFAQALYQALK